VTERVLIARVVLSALIIISFRLFNCYVLLLFKLRVAFYYAFTCATLQTKNGTMLSTTSFSRFRREDVTKTSFSFLSFGLLFRRGQKPRS
jgi:predicted membrane-bound mannosyltransferase